MRSLGSRTAALVLGSLFGASLAGCANDTSSDGQVGSGAESATGGSGGAVSAGGAGGGGTAGGHTGPCEQDCSTIQTGECLVAVCNEGQLPGDVGKCSVVPDDGAACDDGVFCTVGDTCSAGQCVGGPPNTCDMTPEPCTEVVCDEGSGSCNLVPSLEGTPCVGTELCEVNATCQNGSCVGNPKDCTFFPGSDCNVGVCNPSTGACEGVADPTKDGMPCTDLSDLCTENKTCDGGACVGGSPVNCSGLTMGCVEGVCDPANGSCVAQAIGDGMACNDFDACTSGESCMGGICGMSSPVTVCMTGDGCCPATCNAANDLDCACGIDKIVLAEVHIGSPDYARLHNPTPCDIDLDPLNVLFDDSTSTDLAVDLPSFVLLGGASVYLIESGGVGDDIDTGNILFDPTRAGNTLLCDGPCDLVAGSNIIDAMQFEGSGSAVALPGPATFAPGPLTGITSANASGDSFLKQTDVGAFPNFLASDWTVGPKTK